MTTAKEAKKGINMQNPEAFDQLADKAISALGKFLDGEDFDKQQIAAARVASSIVSSWTRQKQTESAREATLFMMARELAHDKDQLRQYIASAAPSSPLVKALPIPKAA